MKTYNSKEEAQTAAAKIINSKDWEMDSITVSKAYKPLAGVDGWILLDAWSKPL